MKTCGDCTYTGCAQACQEFSTLAKKQGERIADIEKENEKLREALAKEISSHAVTLLQIGSDKESLVDYMNYTKELEEENKRLREYKTQTERWLAGGVYYTNEESIEHAKEFNMWKETALAQGIGYADLIIQRDRLREELAKRDEYNRQIEEENLKICDAIQAIAIENQKLREALDWIASVNAMDYEYQAVAREAIKRGAV